MAKTALSLLFSVLFLCVSLVLAEPPHRGSFAVEFRDYRLDTLSPLREVVVAYPVGSSNQSFPFLSFAHGLLGGGIGTQIKHISLLESIASHGFIVAATKSCNIGCPNGGFEYYYEEQLKVIVWAQSPEMRNDEIISQVDHSLGYGIVGHSMGGQATARSAARANSYNIKAAVLLHPYCEVFETVGRDIQVPLAAFTGTLDGCCGETETRRYYDVAPVPKTLANMIGATHYEPNFGDSRWGVYTAAFFKVWMQGDTGLYHDLIYNADYADSLCTFYEMETCEHQNMKF